MASRFSDLLVRVGGELRPSFSATLSNANRALLDLDRTARASTGGFRALAANASTLGQSLTVGITAPLAGFAAVALKAAAEQERLQIGFKVLTGSAEQARKTLSDIRAIADRTPFEFPELARAGQGVLRFVRTADEVPKVLRTISDAVSATGGTGAELQGVVLALSQISAKGKVSAEELNQLSERNIPAIKILAKEFGVTTAELLKLVERGVVPADRAIQALLSGLDKSFGGASQLQSQTLGGLFSTFRDEANKTAAEIGGVLAPTAKSFLTDVATPLLKEIAALSKSFAELPESVRLSAVGFAGAAAAAGPTLIAFSSILQASLALSPILKSITLGIGGLALQFGTAANAAIGASTSIAAVAATLTATTVAAGLAVVALVDLIQKYQDAEKAKAEFEGAQKTSEDSISRLVISLRQQGVAVDEVYRAYGQGEISETKLLQRLRQLTEEHVKLKGPIDKVGAAKLAAADSAKKLALENDNAKVKTIGLKDAFRQLNTELENQLNNGAFRQLPAFLKDAIREEDFSRRRDSIQLLARALIETRNIGGGVFADLSEQSEAFSAALARNLELEKIGETAARLQLVGASAGDAFRIAVEGSKLSKLEIAQLLDQVSLLAPAFRAISLEVAQSLQIDPNRFLSPLLEADAIMRKFGLQSTLQTRLEVDRLRAALGRLYELRSNAGDSAGIINDDINKVQEAIKKAEGVTEKTKQGAKPLIEVSTIITNLSQGIANELFPRLDGVLGILARIGESITANIIQKLLSSSGIIDKLAGGLGGLLGKIPGLGGIFGGSGAVIKNAAGAAAAPSASVTAAANQAAQAGLASTIGAIGSVASAVSGIIGNFQQATANRRLGFVEQNTRGALNQAIAQQETFNQYLPELANIRGLIQQIITYGVGIFSQDQSSVAVRFADANALNLNAEALAPLRFLEEIRDRVVDLVEITRGFSLPAVSAAGGVTVQISDSIISEPAAVDRLADLIARRLQQRGS